MKDSMKQKNARTKWSSTALMFATEKGHVQCVNYFIEKGAKVNIRNSYGETSLIYAASCGRSSLSVQILLKARAKINMCDVYGQNALENHLVENPFVNRQLAMLLLAAGEKLKGRKIYKYDTRGRAFATLLIPYFLRQDHQQFCLMHQCRKVIRQRLLDSSPHEHLFNRVPLIGLPSMLANYLLFDVSLDADYHNNDNDDYRRTITLLPQGTRVYAVTATVGFIEEDEDYSDDDEYWREDSAVNFEDDPFRNDNEEAEEEPQYGVEGQGEADSDYSSEDKTDDGQCNQEENYVNEKKETGKENAEFTGNKEAVNQLENEKNDMDAEEPQELEDQQDEFIEKANIQQNAGWLKQDCGSRESTKHGRKNQLNNVNKLFDKNEEGHHQPKQIQTVYEMGQQIGKLTKPGQAEEINKLKAMDENKEHSNKDQEKANEVEEWKHKEEVANEKMVNGAITKITLALQGSQGKGKHHEEEKEDVSNFVKEKEDGHSEAKGADCSG